MFVETVKASAALDVISSQATTVATEHSEQVSEGLLASLGISGSLFVFQLINFVVVALILWYLVLKPITKKMSERAALIDRGLKNAEEVENNLRKSEQKFQEKIDEAKVEASKIIQQAQVGAEQLAQETKEKSKQEIERLVNQAKKNIQREKQEMLDGVKSAAAELVVSALEKILEEKMDEKRDKDFIKKMLARVK